MSEQIMEAIFARLVDRDDGTADELERDAGIEDIQPLDELTAVVVTPEKTYTLTLEEV